VQLFLGGCVGWVDESSSLQALSMTVLIMRKKQKNLDMGLSIEEWRLVKSLKITTI